MPHNEDRQRPLLSSPADRLREAIMSSPTIIAFPRPHRDAGVSGIRAARVARRWCVERLMSGTIIHRAEMPTMEDAQRIAARVSRRDRVTLLPMRGGAGGRP